MNRAILDFEGEYLQKNVAGLQKSISFA